MEVEEIRFEAQNQNPKTSFDTQEAADPSKQVVDKVLL